MRLGQAGLLAFFLGLGPSISLACPDHSDALLFHSCWGTSRVDLIVLPEDAAMVMAPGGARELIVTGAYTGKQERAPGKPAPVGLMMRTGEVIGRHAARMDGILMIEPERRRVGLYRRSSVPLGDRSYDLAPLDQRAEFFTQASARNVSLLQSHLIVIDGEPDTRPVPDAPRNRRRILFTDQHGYGVWETPEALTLHDAANAVMEAVGPDMALNLDMGTFNYCALREASGSEQRCGAIGWHEASAKLSNLLVFRTR